MEAFETDSNPDRKRPHHNPLYSELDAMVFEWYDNKAHDVAVTGPMIQSKALEVANALNQPDFKASGGWLSRFKSRHFISGSFDS